MDANETTTRAGPILTRSVSPYDDPTAVEVPATAEELARESGLPESTVDIALEVLGRLLAAAAAGR